MVGLLSFAAGALVVLLVLALRADEPGGRRQEPARPAATQESLSLVELAAVEEAPRSSAADLQTLGRALEEYWGERWAVVREQLPDGIDLTAPVDAPLPPWEEVAARIGDMLHETNGQVRMIESRYR